MKLVRISHSRCNEWDSTSYVFAPDHWSEAEINERVLAAKKEYMAADRAMLEDAKSDEPPRPLDNISTYAKYPDKTVQEVKELIDEQRAAHDVWKKRRDAARQPFSHYLTQQGFVRIQDAEGAVEVDVDWGHNHGWDLKYRDQVPDKPGSLPPLHEYDS